MTEKVSLAERFKSAPSSTRTGIIGAGVVIVVLVVGTLMTGTAKTDVSTTKTLERQNVISNNARTQTNDDLAGEIAVAKKEIRDQKAALDLLAEQERLRAAGDESGQLKDMGTLLGQVQILQERLAAIENGSPKASAPNAAPDNRNAGEPGELVLGPDGKPMVPAAGNTRVGSSSAPPQTPSEIQVVTAVRKPVAEASLAYLAAGSNFEAVLMNGMDASTAMGSNKTPTPSLLRVKSEAILANLQSYDVQDCFVLVGGAGNLSSERVDLRTETMSCYSANGQVWEGKIEGYVVGEDGKAGARGRLVSKQGALLAKTFMAGFVGGLGSAFGPQASQSLNLNTSGQQAENYQFPSTNKVLGAGVSKGLSDSASKLASFYISMAEQMFPILELDSGRKVTIILLKGVELKLERKS